MSLAQAREEATKLSLLVKEGTDIADQRRRERLKLRKKAAEAVDPRKMAFKTIASMWLDARIKTGYYDKNVGGASVVESYLNRNINPAKADNLISGNIPLFPSMSMSFPDFFRQESEFFIPKPETHRPEYRLWKDRRTSRQNGSRYSIFRHPR